MHIMSLIDCPQAIPLGVFAGATGMRDVIDHMNATWRASGSGVIFGEGVFGDRYRAFRELISDRQDEIIKSEEASIQAVTCPDKFQVIDSQEALMHVPLCMHIPILTYAPVRKLYDEGMLRGWDVKPEDMPDEDVVGRLINNGRSVLTILSG